MWIELNAVGSGSTVNPFAIVRIYKHTEGHVLWEEGKRTR